MACAEIVESCGKVITIWTEAGAQGLLHLPALVSLGESFVLRQQKAQHKTGALSTRMTHYFFERVLLEMPYWHASQEYHGEADVLPPQSKDL